MENPQRDDWEAIVPFGQTGAVTAHTDGWVQNQADFEIERLIMTLNRGRPVDWHPEPFPVYPDLEPVFVHVIDPADDGSIILIIRTGSDGVTRGIIALPKLDFISPEVSDGPHLAPEVIALARRYAVEYGYGRIVVDIESSQLWDASWGTLFAERDDPTRLDL